VDPAFFIEDAVDLVLLLELRLGAIEVTGDNLLQVANPGLRGEVSRKMTRVG